DDRRRREDHGRRGRRIGRRGHARSRSDPHARHLRAAHLPGRELREADRAAHHEKARMSYWTVTTVHEEGAAGVVKEALDDAGIPVEICRRVASPTKGSMTAMVYEVRVPDERAGEAEKVLARIQAELEHAIYAQAGFDPPPDDAAPEQPIKRRKLGVAQIGYL